MHSNDAKHDCLTAVLTAQEAATLWGLSRNAISDACRRGALRGRKSGIFAQSLEKVQFKLIARGRDSKIKI
jgi:hypothetical protein